MWTQTPRTLAHESRHIVVVTSVGTISRAADGFLSFLSAFMRTDGNDPIAGGQRGILPEAVRAAAGPNKDQEKMMWPEERVEFLKKLWTGGLSASQIAGELGGITRN